MELYWRRRFFLDHHPSERLAAAYFLLHGLLDVILFLLAVVVADLEVSPGAGRRPQAAHNKPILFQTLVPSHRAQVFI